MPVLQPNVPRPAFPASSFAYNPLLHLRVLFVQFLQGLFSAAPKNTYRWCEDDNATEILVRDEGVIHAELTQKRPAITIARGAVKFQSMGLDDMESYDLQTNTKVKSALNPGTITFNCLSRNPLESEHLAFLVATHFWLLKDELLKNYGMFNISSDLDVSETSPAGSLIAGDQGDEYTVTKVTLAYIMSQLGSVTPLNQNIVNAVRAKILATPARPIIRTMGDSAEMQQGAATVLGAPRAADNVHTAVDASGHTVLVYTLR